MEEALASPRSKSSKLMFQVHPRASQPNKQVTVEFSAMVNKLRGMKGGIKLSVNKGLRGSYKYSFTGKELISWLVEYVQKLEYLQDKQTAEAGGDYTFQPKKDAEVERTGIYPLADKLVERAVIVQLNKKKKNKNSVRDESSVFYRFEDDYQRRILIIGGGFAGAKLAKLLENEKYFNVTLIDSKPYFEYILSLPHSIESGNFDRIRIEYSKILRRTKFFIGGVAALNTSKIVLQDGKEFSIEHYDRVILCTGSRYRIHNVNIERTEGQKGAIVINGMCSQEFKKNYDSIRKAKSVVVVGSGMVGVEIAAALAVKYSDMLITLISSANKVMERSCPGAHDKVVQFFLGMKNVKVLLGEQVTAIRDTKIHTNKNRVLDCEVAVLCIGFSPNTDYLLTPTGKTTSHSSEVLDNLLGKLTAEEAKQEQVDMDLEQVEEIEEFAKRASVNYHDFKEGSLEAQEVTKVLHKFCETGNHIALKLVLDQVKGTRKCISLHNDFLDFSNEKSTLLHTAARFNKQEVVNFLIDFDPSLVSAKDAIGATPMFHAIVKGHANVTALLISRGSQVNVKDHYDNFPLQLALKYNLTTVTRMLFLFQAEVNYKGKNSNTVLHFSCQEGSISKCKFLLEQQDALFAATNRNEETPLMHALPHPDLVQYLLDYAYEFHPSKASKWIQMVDDRGYNIIHRCVENGYIKSLMNIICKIQDKYLAKMINEPSKREGNTPGHLAARTKDPVLLLALCMTELVDFRVKNSKGERVRDLTEDPTTKALVKTIPQRKLKDRLEGSPCTPEFRLVDSDNSFNYESILLLSPKISGSSGEAGNESPCESEASEETTESENDTTFSDYTAESDDEEDDLRGAKCLSFLKQKLSKDEEKQKFLEIIENAYHCSSYLDSKGFVKVNKYFNVTGTSNLFAIGDITNLQEEKLAQTAQVHAALMFRNIKRAEHHKPLIRYVPRSRVCLVSLGHGKAILTKGDKILMDSMVASIIKDAVEKRCIGELKK